MIFDKLITITDALKNMLFKKVLALSPDIGTAEIQQMDADIRQRSFFSARTPYAEYLADTQKDIQNLLQPDLLKSGESLSPAQVRAAMKQRLDALGYVPAEAGGLKDLSSDKRINLIISTQLGMARGYGSWRQAQQPTILNTWPADELFRAIDKKEPRDWQARWNTARFDLTETSATVADSRSGPFVALKNDPIWTAISDFDNPYPPFAFGSGMRVRDVSRSRAIELGVLDQGQSVQPADDPFSDPALADIPAGLPADLETVLAESFSTVLSGIKEAMR